MLTSRTARWSSGTALLCLALLAMSWLFLVSPRRSEAAELRDQNTATQSQNDLLDVKIAQLRAQFAKLPESQAELAAILTQMPADAGVPRLVRDLDAMARSTGVTLTSVTPGAGQALLAATPAAAGAAGAAGTPGAGAVGTAGAATDGSTVVSVPVSVVLSGDYFQTVAFLKQIQTDMPRAFLLTTVQMSAGAGGASGGASATGGTVQVTLSGQVFALPGMTADLPATAAGPGSDAAKSPIGAAASPAPTATPAASSPPAASPSSSPSSAVSSAPSAAAGVEVS
jgi:Tfp pilus assembly protein PilO